MDSGAGRANVRIWGSPEEGKVVIYVRKQVCDAIYSHGAANPQREVGGLLLGNVTESDGKYKVDIVGVARAESAPGSHSQMQFTGEVWRGLIESAQRSYPNQKVVGWYHTHPGFGVFLSEEDVRCHQVAFSQPWHVAAVCDATKGQLSFFGWDDSTIKLIRGFYTYEIAQDTAAPLYRGGSQAVREPIAPVEKAQPRSRDRTLIFLLPSLCILLSLFVGAFILMSGRSPTAPMTGVPASDVPGPSQNTPVASSPVLSGSGDVAVSPRYQCGNAKHEFFFIVDGSSRQIYRIVQIGANMAAHREEKQLPVTLTSVTCRLEAGENIIRTLRIEGYDTTNKQRKFICKFDEEGRIQSIQEQPLP